MEIINPNSLPGANARACGTDALLPPHIGGGGGSNHGPGCDDLPILTPPSDLD